MGEITEDASIQPVEVEEEPLVEIPPIKVTAPVTEESESQREAPSGEVLS